MGYGLFFTALCIVVGFTALVPLAVTHNKAFGMTAFFVIFFPGIFFAWELTSLLYDGKLFKKGSLMQAARDSSVMFKSWALSMLGLIAVSAAFVLLDQAR